MFEKCNPCHPDKIADRIAGAIVDLCYSKQENPKVAVEVLIGHGRCYIIAETSVIDITHEEISDIVSRIAGKMYISFNHVPQDRVLAGNQEGKIRCGDNGIFKGVPVTVEQKTLSGLARKLYKEFHADGKYLIDRDKITICQSHATEEEIREFVSKKENLIVNPLGYWFGGLDVDAGATNRKLGSDMGDSVTGGGLHGKDLSKADVSVNIYAWLKAQREGRPVELSCAIGDATVDGRPYSEIVEIARTFICARGGFEKFAEWGLICQ